ncbi:MAG: hypothetical protein ABIO83_09745 [Ilumatobacteraceae bacterium]
MADMGRAAVYAAEIAAFEGTSYESITPFPELLGLASLITNAGWWPYGSIRVVPARSDAGSSSARQRGTDTPVIRLASPQTTPATLVHEFAHVLAGVARGHDRVFRRAHVDLTGFLFGEVEATWLLDAYATVALAPGLRVWPAPPVRRGTGGPLAL